MDKKQMVIYHLHTELSNPQTIDSVTSMDDYIEKAKELGMSAIGRTEHGNIYEWLKIKKKVEKAGLKYLHGAEFYVTEQLEPKERDNYHFVLYAKNTEGKKELNKLMSVANREDHRYYAPRITLNELYNTSSNILVTTACMQNLLWKSKEYKSLSKQFLEWASENSDRVFLEVQTHISEDQKKYNKMLSDYSKKYNIRLIAGTDTHSLNKMHQEARSLIKYAKGYTYNNEDDFDLTFYGRDKAEEMFKKQNVLTEDEYTQAIDNTNVFADMIEEYEISSEFKYPELYDEPQKELENMVLDGWNKYKELGVINKDTEEEFTRRVSEELEVFHELGMESFMSFMGELSRWCEDNDIIRGDGRGSVAGSTVAYLLDIIDVNPVEHNTIFSRFCNKSRVTLGDIDLDFSDSDRPAVFKYITDRFGQEYTARVVTFGTMAYKGAIDEIIRGLDNKHKIKNKTSENIYGYDKSSGIKNLFADDEEKARKDYPEIFKYFDIIEGSIIQVGTHAGGIVATPILLSEHVGVSLNQDSQTGEYMWVTNCSKKVLESHGYVKYDILGLKNIDILKHSYELSGRKYEKAHEIDWNDDAVWDEMLKHSAGIFQFTGDYAFSQLKKINPSRIKDMTITNALLRPSGASIRDDYYNDIHFKNPSKEIDEMFEDQKGYVIFQEDTIAYLQNICGLSGSEADTVRRAIGAKDHETMNEWLPKIKEGYRKYCGKPKDKAYEEVENFITILSDSADYQFGYNHSTGYSMLGYRCARERLYHPLEFVTAFLKTSHTESDIQLGTSLANYKNVDIKPITYGKSKGSYFMDTKTNTIYKGLGSIKHLNSEVGDILFDLSQNNTYDNFVDLLIDMKEKTSLRTNQLDILILLDYFRDFGNSKKLLKLASLFDSWYDKSQLHKERNEDDILGFIRMGITLKDIKELQGKEESPKLYRSIDFVSLIKRIDNVYSVEDFSISEKIDSQQEYLGYINMQIDNIPSSVCVCTDIDDKYTPKLTMHSLATGNSFVGKIAKKTFAKYPVSKGDIINIFNIKEKYGWQKVDEEWKRNYDRTDWWIESYQFVDDINEVKK